jgi:hypothetical protein
MTTTNSKPNCMTVSPNSKAHNPLSDENTRYALVEDLIESVVVRFVKKYGMSDEDHQLARSCAFKTYMQAERLYNPALKVPFAAYIAMRVGNRLIDWRADLYKDRNRFLTENRLADTHHPQNKDDERGTIEHYAAGEAPVAFMDILRDSLSTDALEVARVAVNPDNECMAAAGGQFKSPEHDHKHRMEIRTYFMLAGWSVSRVSAAFAELQNFLGDHIDTTGRASHKTSHKTH